MTSPILLSLTGPCRETDCLIFELGHRLLTPARRGAIDGEPTGEYFDLDGNQLPERAPYYTASLDAAMTLKAEDIDLDLSYSIILVDGKAWFAELTGGDPHQTGFWPQQGRGHSGACAVTAAILRARSALEASHG